MTTLEIIEVAGELNCGPDSSAITFARMIAERCALLVDQVEGDGGLGGSCIRKAFNLT